MEESEAKIMMQIHIFATQKIKASFNKANIKSVYKQTNALEEKGTINFQLHTKWYTWDTWKKQLVFLKPDVQSYHVCTSHISTTWGLNMERVITTS